MNKQKFKIVITGNIKNYRRNHDLGYKNLNQIFKFLKLDIKDQLKGNLHANIQKIKIKSSIVK